MLHRTSKQKKKKKNVLSRILCKETACVTLPAWFAGGLDVDLDEDVLGGPVLPAVVGGHGQLVHALLAVVELLCVLDVA